MSSRKSKRQQQKITNLQGLSRSLHSDALVEQQCLSRWTCSRLYRTANRTGRYPGINLAVMQHAEYLLGRAKKPRGENLWPSNAV